MNTGTQDELNLDIDQTKFAEEIANQSKLCKVLKSEITDSYDRNEYRLQKLCEYFHFKAITNLKLLNDYMYLYDQYADGGPSTELNLGCMKTNKYKVAMLETLFMSS